MLRDTQLDLYTVGDGNWYKSSLGMYLTQANPSDFVNPYRFAGGDPANRGTSWGGSSEPSMLWRFSLGLFLDDTIQVARNTGHLSGLERAYVVGGFFLADMIGVRGLSDAFSRHDAAHGHVQSGFERGMDGVFGAVGIGMTAVGLPGAGKAGGILGKVGSKAAANTVDNVAIEAAEKIAARSMTKAEWKVYNRAQRVAAREVVDLAPNRAGKIADEVAALRRVAANNQSPSGVLLHQKINLRGAVVAERDALRATLSSAERGPVLTGVLDRTTGRTFFGLNPEAAAISEFHPLIAGRIAGLPQASLHSEVVALNRALLARGTTGSVDLSDFVLFNARFGKYGQVTAPVRGPNNIVRCQTCTGITDGVISLSSGIR